MTLKPLAEILKLTKDGINEVLAPARAKRVKASATLKIAEIEERLVSMEADVQESCSVNEIDFDEVVDKLDEIALLERKKTQLNKIVNELFPA